MKKSILALLLAIAAVLMIFTGCGEKADESNPAQDAVEETAQPAAQNTEEVPAEEKETRLVTDTMGREVEIAKDVKKIIAIPWPWSSFVFAVDGSAEKISSMSATALESYKNCMFEVLAPGLADSDSGYIDDKNKDGGSFGTLNIEELAKIDPDVVIIYKRDAEAMLPILEVAKIPTLVFDFGGLQQVQDGLRILGEILGEDAMQRAEQIITWHTEAQKELDSRLAEVAEEDKPSVLFFNSRDLKLYNSGFTNTMIRQSGGRLAAVDDSGEPAKGKEVNFEQVLKWDPDYIFLTNFFDGKPEEIYNNEMADQDWSQLKAVKNGHVYKVPMGIYRWSPPSTEAHLFITWMAKIYHPELMADIDLKSMTEDFYSILFEHTLTQDELDMIYHSDLNAGSEPVALEAVK